MNVQQQTNDKGQHYLDLLDVARSQSRWTDVPELLRKVEKHAPRRECLVLTARVEAQISTKASGLSRPTTPSLSQNVAPLQSAIENEKSHVEDVLQARICLAWLHYALGASELAYQQLPPSLRESFSALTKDGTTSSKTRALQISIVRGGYIKGACCENSGKLADAVAAYDDILPLIVQSQALVASSAEYRHWANQVLQKYCKHSSNYLDSSASKPERLLVSSAPIAPANLLKPFRIWSSITSSQAVSFAPGRPSYFLTQTWRSYYTMLSTLLAFRSMSYHDHLFASSANHGDFDFKFAFESRSRHLSELRQVQSAYEAALFRDYDFPQANESHLEIDGFIDQVISNWQIACSPAYQDGDLGEGGKIAYTQRIIATLYAAAKKSFHSTRLLRHLFTAHTALAEFDLAGKAIRSYFEIVKKGQAKVEKSGKPETGLDDDNMVLTSASSAIHMLCRYGRRSEAKRANDLVQYIVDWLEKHDTVRSHTASLVAEDIPKEMSMKKSGQQSKAAGATIAMAFRARGLYRCHWARLAYEAAERSSLYKEADHDYRLSMQQQYGGQNIESSYALAYVLSEQRDVDAAVLVLKEALTMISQQHEEADHVRNDSVTHLTRNTLSSNLSRLHTLRSWHLMSLLLSSRETYSAAIDSCKAALELYEDEPRHQELSKGSVLGLDEKTSIINLKITQLAMVESLEGPEEAVNQTDELLEMYTKLFRQASVSKLTKPDPSLPPPSSNGTVTSFRHSILGRSKKPFASLRRSRHPKRPVSTVDSTESPSSPLELTRPPTISVTDDEGPVLATAQSDRPTLVRQESRKLQKRNSKRSVGSYRRSYDTSPIRLSTLDSSASTHIAVPLGSSRPTSSNTTDGLNDSTVGVALSNEKRTFPPSQANPDPGVQSSLSIYLRQLRPPEPFYPPYLLQRHSLTLLVKIWLFISSLYHRASILTDSLAAISEAENHVKTIETLVATHDNSSEESFTIPGWGGLKSVAELWADILAAKADIKKSQGEKELAAQFLEEALLWDEDHLAATISLSELLMDEYEAFFHPPASPTSDRPPTLGSLPSITGGIASPSQHLANGTEKPHPPSSPTNHTNDPSPETLSAISARDRAYMLLSQMTDSGRGWDSSEAWSAMVRCWELSGEEEKAIEASWKVVDLEGTRGVRSWQEALGGPW